MNFVCLWYGVHEVGEELRDTFSAHINLKLTFYYSFAQHLETSLA
jgi:hypothetical protein